MKIPFAWLFRTRRAKAGLLVAGLYLATYAALSLCGHYQGNVTSLDQIGIITRGVDDLDEWQPAFVMVTHFPAPPGQPRVRRANTLGLCFLPLVMLDQQYCHATKPITFGR